jgi:hypothetical protein
LRFVEPGRTGAEGDEGLEDSFERNDAVTEIEETVEACFVFSAEDVGHDVGAGVVVVVVEGFGVQEVPGKDLERGLVRWTS